MPTRAMFPAARARTGMYESFYLRAVAPDRPLGIWIRHTVHKRPGAAPRGSLWCTVFDASQPSPFMHKLTSEALEVPAGGWIAVGDAGQVPEQAGQGGVLTPERAWGGCGPARWSLRWSALDDELRHLPRPWLYRAPLPRTKLTSPAPAASFDGHLEIAGQRAIELSGWRGMVGHNWGSEHAERWIWLHGVGFAERPQAWLDVALGRIKLAGRMTPWVANGALSLDGRRYSLGGLGARGLQVAESATGAELAIPGDQGLSLQARVRVPPATAAGWRYADPGPDGEHDVLNCSIAALSLSVALPGAQAPVELHSPHGGAYELGMRERDHGVAIAPFPDG